MKSTLAKANAVSSREIPDGLNALHNVIKLSEIMRWIELTARWVDPTTFRLLPVWYPEYYRNALFYKTNWSEAQLNKGEHKREGNRYANIALTSALGLRSKHRPNWSCCHIWGVDDPKYQQPNAVVQDPHFYSCIANMVLLPVPLKAFTDTMPRVKAMLRVCAQNLYGWSCQHDSLFEAVAEINDWKDWDSYPASWPRRPGGSSVPGVMPIDDTIRASISRRLCQIKSDLENAGSYYPRDKVREVLEFWKISL